MIDFTAAYKDKSVKVVGVSVNDLDSDRIPKIKDYMKEHKSNYIYGYDESQKVGHAYGATNTPQFFVFDKERKIRYLGAMDDNMDEAKVKKTYLKDAVEALLKGETPAGRRDPPPGLRREVQEQLTTTSCARVALAERFAVPGVRTFTQPSGRAIGPAAFY